MKSLSARCSGAVLLAVSSAPWAQTPAPAIAEAPPSAAYQFNPRLLRGASNAELSAEHLNRAKTIAPGEYSVDLALNGLELGRYDVLFQRQADAQVSACFNRAQLLALGVREERLGDLDDSACIPLARQITGASEHLDSTRLHLALSIPQAHLLTQRRGEVPREAWNNGDNLGFINYNANHFQAAQREASTYSSYLGLQSGVNLNGWRLRHQSSLTAARDSAEHWKTLRTYAQYSLPDLSSQLTLGESFTSGRLLSSMAYRGVQLGSDERMLPDSLRGYAPTVRGIAQSNARVIVRQNGNELYQTTVPPGSFEIDDLYPTGYGGDLDVEITEADGQVSRFKQTYSAQPDALRPGLTRYSLTAAHTRDNGMGTTPQGFLDGTYEYGLSNALSLRSASRAAEGYQSLLLGGVYSHRLGAFGLDTTLTRADTPDARKRGAMTQLSYSRTFQASGTGLSLSTARYSSEGYRELIDVLGERARAHVPQNWSSRSYQQKSRVSLQLNQTLADYGTLYVSASQQHYRNREQRNRQLQAGYSIMLGKGVGLNLSLARQYDGLGEHSQTRQMLSLTVPLGRTSGAPKLATSFSHSSDRSDQYQASLAGTTGTDNDFNYSLHLSQAGGGGGEDEDSVIGAALQQRHANAALGASLSRGEDFWQGSTSAMGALVVHEGGVTPAPYLGETFALIEAKGAEGARVMNGQGARINAAGYGVMPSLNPFRYNDVGLSSHGLQGNVELKQTQRRVAPMAGAALRLHFETLAGHALLIRAPRDDGRPLPMGATVYDSDEREVGMVGQASQLYARVDHPQGELLVSWGEAASEQCRVAYRVDPAERLNPLISIASTCHPSAVEPSIASPAA